MSKMTWIWIKTNYPTLPRGTEKVRNSGVGMNPELKTRQMWSAIEVWNAPVTT